MEFDMEINHERRKIENEKTNENAARYWQDPSETHRSILIVKDGHNAELDENVLWDELFLPKRGINFTSKPPDDTFHRAIGPILTVGQLFGIMPVVGILEKDASFLRFEGNTWRMANCVIFLTGGGFLSILSFMHMVHLGFSVDNAGMLVFYGSSFFVQVLFLRLSARWAALGREIAAVEGVSALTPRPPRGGRFSLKKRFSCCCFTILFLALVEHTLCIMSGIANAYNCDDFNPVVKGHYITAFPQVFSWTGYTHWKAFILQIMNLSATFLWNFMDLFIILLSLGLANSFEQLNRTLEYAMKRNFPEHFWQAARNEYAHVARLVRKVDDAINHIILMSFTENLYIICRQLFHSVKVGNVDDPNACWKAKNGLFGGVAGSVYFVFSFGFLVTRFLAVVMYSSRVHLASRQPLGALYSVAQKLYSVEIQRFLDHVTSDTIALTGLNFFYITRSLILTIAGTVVTYELVMVQFNMPQIPLIVYNNTCEVPFNTTFAP